MILRGRFPPEELAIQWDCSTEVQDSYGSILGFSAGEARSSAI